MCHSPEFFEGILVGPSRLLTVLEHLTGNKPSPEDVQLLCRAPEELDFIRAALEDTMRISYQHLREHWRGQDLPDLRTAAHLHPINRVGEAYTQAGIYP